jgi:hypothetical protein
MPLTFEEMAHWSNDDINAQILRNLPKGWKFELQTLPEGWRASYSTSDNPEKPEVWAEHHYALRVLLLSAFMWLWQQKNPTRVHPAWNPAPSRPLALVRPSNSTPERPDLDPRNIRSVYSAHARKWGKESG